MYKKLENTRRNSIFLLTNFQSILSYWATTQFITNFLTNSHLLQIDTDLLDHMLFKLR